MEPRVSIVVEDLIFNDSTKKFVLLHTEDGGTKFPRKPLYVRIYQQHEVILHKTATLKFTAVRENAKCQISSEYFSKAATIEREI